MAGRETDNVHLEFLLGSVRRNSRNKRSLKYKASQSTPPSLEGTLDRKSNARNARNARQRWMYAREAILSQGSKLQDFQVLFLENLV